MISKTLFLSVALSLLTPLATQADELILAADGKSDYQIILPDQSLSPAIAESLQQTARLIQTAFQANGFQIEVVPESQDAKDQPGIYLGNTGFAKKNGINVKQFKGWSYVHKTIGKDVIIAGYDHPSPGKTENARRPDWDRIGTTKGSVDFLRLYVGTRFLYPDLGTYQAVNKVAGIDLLNSPAIEYLPLKKISLPTDLNIHHTPPIEFNVAHPITGGFYDIANNRFPRIDVIAGAHTYGRAIPVDPYHKSHPEYFSLINGKRLLEGAGQYCISNPEVQELIYKDLLKWADRGYETVDIGQPDGFRPCQCEDCKKLFDTGGDWGEKLWIFHRNLAQRLLKDRPNHRVIMMSYIQTANPPKTFKSFPKNTRIMLTGTNEIDIAPWREVDVPGGFDGYIYNWTPNLTSRYTPMRTPLFVEKQVKRLVKNNIHSLYRDGAGSLYGLEGPVYYIMGRMFDDAENLQASDLMEEFNSAAFGEVAPQMKQFYDRLYHSIELYAQYLGTRDPAWIYHPIAGRRRKHLSDPFRMLGFLYPPKLLTTLESQLSLAEKRAKDEKIKVRLGLVRREFNYVKSLAKVIHLHTAYEIEPDLASRDRLLDAIDKRNVEIASYFGDRERSIPVQGWKLTLFPPGGHNTKHLRLGYSRYQGPFESTALNWDTKAMRDAPLPGSKRLTVTRSNKALSLDSPEWKKIKASELIALKNGDEISHRTQVKLLQGDQQLYLRIESDLPQKKTVDAKKQQIVSVYLKPTSSPNVTYRFSVSPDANSKTEAAAGFVSDAMDPRHDQFDPDWKADWNYQTQVNAKTGQWVALFSIP
ncbi:MAG: DUF4838 domain-containing protein, partial [Verrucomicrobia bacterium]|nr:DUF4838 domain-containing protein [Verrucomicrobiota bacterium]